MIIITGASNGIGKFLFEEFQKRDFNVVGTYNSTEIKNVSNYYPVDITNIEQVRSFIYSLDLKHCVLINCAGINYNSFAHKADLIMWKKVIDVNLLGTFNMIHTILPIMRSEGYGRIINMSSVVTKYPTPGITAYVASKSALNGLTKSLAIENASKGITVNSVNLGYTKAGMGLKDVPEKYRDIMIDKIPLHRFCDPIEIYNTVQFIIDTEYLTGSVIDINGGLL